MARAGHPHWTVALLATVALVGCVEGGKPLGSGESATTATTTSTRQADRDVEAPEVFQVTAQGLWDGRPSLGGVWVATPDATDPERVMIRNTANGKSVVGALFKRERENPGPPIQISSDAAAALGLLAGQPGEVNITALRRDEAKAPAAAASDPTPAASETAETATTAPASEEAETLDTKAMAAAIDEADPKATPAGDPDTAPDAAVAAAATAEPAPKRKWWQRKPKAEAAAPLADAAALEGATAAAGSAPPASVAPAAVTSAPLDAAPSAPAPSGSGGKSLIQLGIFSVEANAKSAAEMVKKAGAPATVRSETSNGKPYWSVVAGPADTPAERDALMAKVKGLGFADAYFVSR